MTNIQQTAEQKLNALIKELNHLSAVIELRALNAHDKAIEASRGGFSSYANSEHTKHDVLMEVFRELRKIVEKPDGYC